MLINQKITLNTFLDFCGALKRVSDTLFNMIELTDLKPQNKKEIEFLGNLAKLDKTIQSTVMGVSTPITKWVGEAKGLFNIKLYSKREQRYIHYKNKLTELVYEAEQLFIRNKLEFGGRKTQRIDRVKNRPTQNRKITKNRIFIFSQFSNFFDNF